MEWTEQTPLSITNLNNLESRIAAADAAVIAGKSSVYNAIVAKEVTPSSQVFGDLVSAIGIIRDVAPGSVVLAQSLASKSASVSTPFKAKEIRVNVSGRVRVAFELYDQSSGGANGRIYVNGSAVGILRQVLSPPSFVTFTEDITVKKYDLVQLYIWRSGTENVTIAQNFIISIGNTFADVLLD